MLHLKLKSLLFTAIFFSVAFQLREISAEEPIKSYNDFGSLEGLLPEDIGTYPELKTWALYQFYELEEDSPAYGLQNQVCRMIPETGLRFLLEHKNHHAGRIFLYLDLTKYLPKKKARFKSRKLSVFVNGRLKKEIYASKQKNFSNPIEISIEASEVPDGKVSVELIPSKNEIGRFWGVWDAFLVENQWKE